MSTKRKKIIILTDWFFPAQKAGGPIRSVASLSSVLMDEFDCKIISGAKDLGEEQFLPSIKVNSWNRVEDKFDVYFHTGSYFSFFKIIKNEKPDFIYLNGFFSFKNSIFPVLVSYFRFIDTKIIVSVRGMLSSQALSYKSFKKKCFLLLAKTFKFYKNIDWHITKTDEAQDIRDNFPMIKSRVFLVPNLPYIQSSTINTIHKTTDELNLIFLSRIVPIKNLHTLIKAINQLPKDVKVRLDIYGNIEDQNYFQEIQTLISSIDGNLQINYVGLLDNSQVPFKISNYHFLIHPSSSENYGHSIVEALCTSTPVIIGSNNPWSNIEEFGAGFVISDVFDSDLWTRKLLLAHKLNDHSYQAMKSNAYKYANEFCLNKKLVQDSLDMFRT